MIDNDRVKCLSQYYLEQIKDMNDGFDCWDLECHHCPFELDEPYDRGVYVTYRCALSYAKELYRRLTE